MDPQSSALRERVTGETDSGGDLIYCICRTTKSDGFMICCEKCSEWFHGTCIAITEEFAKNIHQYNCDLCVSKCADLEKIIYRKRYLKELDRLKQETEIMDSLKCGECIQCCYNKKGCEKCDGCMSIPPGQCVKRRCVQAEILYKEQKGAVGRPRREVSTKSADDSDDSPLSPGVPHAVDVHSPPEKEKGKRGRKKGWRKDQQLQPQQVTSSVKVDDPEKLKKEVDLNKDPEIDQEIARSVYDSYTRRRGGRQSKNELKAIQCLGPECQRQTRENSKYCSDECGRKLAKARLLTILPGRVDNFWATAPRADVRAAEQIRELDQIADNLQCRVGKLLEYIAMIHKFLQAMKDQEPLGLDDKEVTEGDVVSNCTICGLEFSSRQLSKHVERCFVRAEKQQTFGMPTKCPFNPNELFCDSFNKGTNTYCKRLRVLCPEHYKGDLEADMKVCGCPNVWMKTTSQTFEDIFISTEYFLNEKFCMLPRKDCLQHHRWIQVIIGLVESERMNVLTRRSEILERRMAIRLANEMRGNAIVLLNSGTVNVEPDNNNKTEIS